MIGEYFGNSSRSSSSSSSSDGQSWFVVAVQSLPDSQCMHTPDLMFSQPSWLVLSYHT